MAIERITYHGWPNCYRASNKDIALIVTADVGPRIIHLGFLDGTNMFAQVPEMLGQTGGDTWRVYGGHRLWHAPEHRQRTYYPDNHPVEVHISAKTLHLVQPVETTTGIQKELEITLAADANRVTVLHRLRNCGPWPVELAPWGLSVMAPGGRGILPLPPRASHEDELLPANALVMWPYNDMSDARWVWGREFIMLQQDPANINPQKIGTKTADGWAAYARQGELFVKTFDVDPAAAYPDMGCSVEMFTNEDMLEVESLGPLVMLEPGAAVEHVERWSIFRDVPTPQTEADIRTHVMPWVQQALHG